MRIVGTSLMYVGAFVMLWAAMSLLGSNVVVNGIARLPTVTSVPGAFIGGGILLFAGAWLRRRATRRSVSDSAV